MGKPAAFTTIHVPLDEEDATLLAQLASKEKLRQLEIVRRAIRQMAKLYLVKTDTPSETGPPSP